jgi:hypothetical protein
MPPSPPASNITEVKLGRDKVTIAGEVVNAGKYKVEVLHVWLAQPAKATGGGGLAFDCVAGRTRPFKGGPFKVIVPTKKNAGVFGSFSAGPATASAIAVLNTKAGPVVQQWSQIITVT